MSIIKSRSAITMGEGCKPYGGKYAKPESILYMNDDTIGSAMYLTVQLHGLISCDTTVGKGSIIGKISNDLSLPGKAISFPAVTNGGIVRLQIEQSGNIVVNQGEVLNYVFLDSVKFDNWLTS